MLPDKMKVLEWLSVRKLLLSFLLFFALYIFFSGNWLRTRYPMQMDANGYYIYLPAAFIYHDLAKLSFVDQMPEQFDRKYFLYRNHKGGYLSKYSPGAAIFQLPFFLAAHVLSPLFDFEQSGYSPPYRLAIALSSLVYTVLAFWLLARILAGYFSRAAVMLTVASLFLGTNVLFYGVLQAGVTHNYLLFVFVLMVFALDKWWKGGSSWYFVLACACVGMSTTIRPTEILTGLVPLSFLWQKFSSGKLVKQRFIPGLSEIAFGFLAFVLAVLPVFLFWKYSTGNWISYTYEQEGFYFDRPSQIWYGLLGFRKGWFIYTPLAAIAVAGIFLIRKDSSLMPWRRALLLYLPVNIYIVLSWYCWWYGGGFGQRSFIPSYAILAIPLALVFEKMSELPKTWLVLPALLIALNLFQSFQYQRQIIHMDAMTWDAYRFIFGKWSLTDAEKKHRNTLLEYPDYLERGKKLNEYFK